MICPQRQYNAAQPRTMTIYEGAQNDEAYSAWHLDAMKRLTADLTVSGTGTAGGNLHLEGTWQAPGPVGNFKISGKLGGRHVAVLVPEA